jgi:hypothetical protein
MTDDDAKFLAALGYIYATSKDVTKMKKLYNMGTVSNKREFLKTLQAVNRCEDLDVNDDTAVVSYDVFKALGLLE